MMEKEARTNKAGADLDKRNRNWEKINTHLADYATLNSDVSLWSGSATSGDLTFLEPASNYVGLAIETNHTTPSGANRGSIFVSMAQLQAASYYPVYHSGNITWIRISATSERLSIISMGNATLAIVNIKGVGKKPSIKEG